MYGGRIPAVLLILVALVAWSLRRSSPTVRYWLWQAFDFSEVLRHGRPEIEGDRRAVA